MTIIANKKTLPPQEQPGRKSATLPQRLLTYSEIAAQQAQRAERLAEMLRSLGVNPDE